MLTPEPSLPTRVPTSKMKETEVEKNPYSTLDPNLWSSWCVGVPASRERARENNDAH